MSDVLHSQAGVKQGETPFLDAVKDVDSYRNYAAESRSSLGRHNWSACRSLSRKPGQRR